MPTLRLFAAAREAAGRSMDEVPGATVSEVLDGARARYGDAFAEVLASSGVWVNGEPTALDAPVGEHDEVAVLPPVSGGSEPSGGVPAGGVPGARTSEGCAPQRTVGR